MQRWTTLTLGALLLSTAAHAQQVRPEIVASFPHDPSAFTQGLLWYGGKLYESTGLRGRSSVRRVALQSGEVEQSVALPQSDFGEGLARVGTRLVQLTWKNGRALVHDLEGFASHGSFEYEGEGWGLCFDGQRLVMSDGSSRLYFRNPTSFALQDQVEVTRNGLAVPRLNELECVGRYVYANVWQSDEIVQIDPQSGEVVRTIDASGLLPPEQARRADVLNGIAFNPDTGHFYLTGKLWPTMFEVRFDFDPDGLPDAVQLRGGPEPTPTPPSGDAEPKAHTHAESASTHAGGCCAVQSPRHASGGPAAAVAIGALAFVRLRRRRRGRVAVRAGQSPCVRPSP